MKVEKLLKSHCKPKSCIYCGNSIEPQVTDETKFNPNSHAGIYRDNPQGWAPHYDVEYLCEECDYYEHYTHSIDGSLLAMRINKVVFDVELREFGIIEGNTVHPAGKLPPSIEPFSEDYYKHLDKILRRAYPENGNQKQINQYF